MTEERARRKLSAILSADAKGYSRLMGEDELATVRTLEAYREVIAEVIRNYSGRVVDSPGDNVLAEFASVVDAVESAVEIQNELRSKNAELPENRRMQFRIGINLGDVVEEGERIYGDGVNIAARVEGLAEGGGICVSGAAFDQIEDKLGLEFQYLGEQVVKNIKKPVRVYRVKMESGVSAVEIGRELPLPDKPSIAVLPFINMSGDPEQEYFSDGMSEDIITALSKVPEMFVIARNSTFNYKRKSANVQQVGRELGVRFVLEGSVRKVGDRMRITAQLIDATTGHHLWAERYDRDLVDIFALQDEITMKILLALQIKLTEGEQARLYGKKTDNLEAYLKVLQGRDHFYRMNKEGNAMARMMLQEAIVLDPNYALAYRFLAGTHHLDVTLGLSKSPKQSLAMAIELTKKAIALDDSLAEAHGLLGYLYLMIGQHEKAIAQGERALALAPSSAENHAWLATILCFADRPEEAIENWGKAIRLDPIPPSWYLAVMGIAYRELGRYEEAIAAAKKALQRKPNNVLAYIVLAATYSEISQEDEARAAAAEIIRLNPKYTLKHAAKVRPHVNPKSTERFIQALRRAGLK